MGLALEKPILDLAAYLDWENVQETRNEYVNGEVFAMVGARDTHNVIAGNVYLLLRNHLKGGPCKTYVSDIKLYVAESNCVFYPDVFVTCESPSDPLLKKDAKLIVEVLSPSTEAYDRGRKFAYYRQLPGLEDYLLISVDEARVEHFHRAGPGQWLMQEYQAGQTLHLAGLAMTIRVDDIFEDVLFTE